MVEKEEAVSVLQMLESNDDTGDVRIQGKEGASRKLSVYSRILSADCLFP